MVNSRILLSGAAIAASVALIVGATFAFFSDTETSEGNTLIAGDLDLLVDSTAHYAGMVCQDDQQDDVTGTVWVEESEGSSTRPDILGDQCQGTFEAINLDGEVFFDLTDIKPGDTGENTISLHVNTNDAWGRLVIDGVENQENDCTEPEADVDISCADPGIGDGELQQNIVFSIWLDQGEAPGFQGDDLGEGDNVPQEGEMILVTSGPLDLGGETLNIWQGLAAAYAANSCAGSGDPDDPETTCPGLAPDGQLIGEITYYFGLEWELPSSVGNIVQTDGLVADMTFEIEQYRNNPVPFDGL